MYSIKQTLIKYLKMLLFVFPLGFCQILHAQPGDALSFDGNDDFVDISSFNGPDKDFTVSLWFYTSASNQSDWASFVEAESSQSGYAWVLRVNKNEQLQLAVSYTSTAWNGATASSSYNTNQWTHIAGTYNNSTKEITLYVNGTKAGTSTLQGSRNPHDQGTFLGEYNNIGTHWEGIIDEVRIWSEVRSQSQIQNLMHQQIASSNYNNLDAYWRLNDGSGTTASDKVGSNNGTLTNFSLSGGSSNWVASNAVLTDNNNIGDGGTFNSDIKAIWSSQTSATSAGLEIKERGTSAFTSSDNMIFAHNGKVAQNDTNTNYGGTTVESRLRREWLIDANTTNHVDLTFTTSNAGTGSFSQGNLADYVLINTSNGSIAQNGASSIDKNNNTITFENVDINSQYTVGTKNATNSPLPVELTYFKAEQVREAVQLTWATASETNNRHFIVQRKIQGQWEQIGKVQGHGTTTEPQEYRYRDRHPQHETNYYRLKQVDFDGSFEFSGIRSVNFEQATKSESLSVEVLENPVQRTLRLSITEDKAGRLPYQLLNSKGEPIKQGNWDLQPGKQQKRIGLQDLPSGVYFLKIRNEDQTILKKVVK